jgi:hypothetical protein
MRGAAAVQLRGAGAVLPGFFLCLAGGLLIPHVSGGFPGL